MNSRLQRKLIALLALFLILLLAQLFKIPLETFFPSPQKNAAMPSVAPQVQGKKEQLYEVARVIDGDTIKIKTENGEQSVRLIGIDTPEIGNNNSKRECFALEAKQFLTERINGKLVRLMADETQQNYDRYGRLLRYVFAEDGTSINRLLLLEGYAFEYTYALPYIFQSDFKKAEKDAQKKQKGLWNQNTCAGQK